MVVDQLKKVRLWARVLLRLELQFELAGFKARAGLGVVFAFGSGLGVESV